MRQVGSTILRVAGVVCLTCAVFAGGTPVRAAEVVIDDFGDAQAQIVAPPTTSSTQDQAVGTILGTERDMEVSRVSGSAGNVTGEVAANQLQFDVLGALDRGRLFTSWDGNDNDGSTLDEVGLGGVDLTDGGTNNTLRLTVDAVTGLCELIVEVFTDASNSSRSVATAGAIGDLFFPFGAFATHQGGGADFTNVGAISVELLADGAASCDLSDFRALGPTVEALKTDALLVDSDADAEADPGETLRYQIEITSEGGTATGVELDDTVGSNLTFVAGSLRVTPVAVNDSYQSVGNVQLAVTNPLLGLLANDFDPDDGGANFTLTAFDAASLQGGAVVAAADGTFTYDAPLGLNGVDSFGYTITDLDGLTDTGTVHILIEGTIWFVDDTNCSPQPCGSGTQADPFGGFHPTQLNGAGGAGDVDGEGDIIFVFEGSGDTDSGDAAGHELENGQTLHGEGVELNIGGITIVPAGNNPILTNTAGTAGHGITLAEDNTIRGLSVAGTDAGSSAFRATADVGTLTIEDSDVSGAGGIFDVPSGGTLNVTFDSVASTSSSGGAGINISGVSGSFTVSNPGAGTDTSIAGADAGISIQDSAGASFSFGETSVVTDATGGDGVDLGGTTGSAGASFTFDDLSVNVAAGNGLLAANSGTLNVGGAASTLSAVGGAALDIDTMTLGGGSATFASLSSTTSTTEGINLDTVTGDLIVTGTTTAAASTGAGIRLIASGGNFTFGDVDVDNPGGGGIFASGMSGQVTFSGASKSVTNVVPNAVVGVDLVASDVDFTNGGLDIDTTAGIGFRATGGGTINVTGSGNTIDVAGMAPHAIDLNGITIGANDVTFDSITGINGILSEGLDFDSVSNAGIFNGGAVTLTSTGGNGIDIAGSSATFNFTSANITSSAGAGINLNGANGAVTFTAVDIDGSANAAIAVTGNTNAVNVNGGTIGASADNGGAVPAVDIAMPASNITIAAAITNTASRAVEVTGPGAGSIEFTGFIDEDGTGFNLDTNTGTTITFRGGIDLDTGANTAFSATNGGTVNVCATADCAAGAAVVNTADTVGGTAVNIQSTTIGGNGVTFQSVSANGGTVGIDIDGGGSGGFTVTGIGATDASGGTIQSTTQNGALIENTNNITLNNMTFNDAANDGGGSCTETVFTGCNAAVEFNTVSTVDITNMTITAFEDHGIFGQSVTDLDITGSDITGLGEDVDADEHGIFVVNLLGTLSGGTDSVFDSLTIDDAQDTAIRVQNSTATDPGNGSNPDRLTVSNSQLTDAGDSGLNGLTTAASANLNVIATGNTITNTTDGVSIEAQAGDAQSTVGGAGVLTNTFSHGGTGDMVTAIRFFASASVDDATVNGTATNNTITLFAQGSPAPVSGLNGVGVSAGGASSGNLGTVRATVNNNTINSSFSGILTQTVHGVITTNEGTGTTAQNVISVDNNIITLDPPVGTATAETVGVGVDGGTTGAGTTVEITNNVIAAEGDASNGASVGIQILPTELGDPAATNTRVCTRITDNDVSTPNNPFAGSFGTTELDVIAAPVASGSFLDVEAIPLGVRTPAQLKADVEPLNTNTEVGDTTGSISGVITGVSACPN